MSKNPIIPVHLQTHGKAGEWHFEAMCIFAATGFFLDEDTYFRGLYARKPASILKPDGQQEIWFKWHYSPREISLKQVTEEFTDLFEHIVKEQIGNKKVILPFSGGLDSRTQAAALKHAGNQVNAYGYRFAGGHDETKYGKQIARASNFPFEEWEIPHSYLWECIDKLAEINGCYSEFTHPRQMAFVDRYAGMGDIFSLGHWGDVLFDDMGVDDDLSIDRQVEIVMKKIIKKGGLELAEALWQAWGLQGQFKPYLMERLRKLLSDIDIPHSANARIRAFKSLYWAPRWTSVNLSVFESVRPISLPYYDDRMCRFICTVPEKHLAGRQIQIEYLKMQAPELARIPWQDHRPFNLYNYHWDKSPWNLPYRLINKLKRSLNQISGKKLIQRNWELQFLGEKNEQELTHRLFDAPAFKQLIPAELVQDFYARFQTRDAVKYSHSLSMLLTFAKATEVQNIRQ